MSEAASSLFPFLWGFGAKLCAQESRVKNAAHYHPFPAGSPNPGSANKEAESESFSL